MHSIDITSDLEAAMKDIGEVFWKDIPFAMSGAMIDTMFDTKRRIVESTYPNAFEVRNKTFPRRLWAVKVDGARGAAMYRVLRNELRSGGVAEVMLQQTLDRGYIQDHVTGGTKTPRSGGRSIAVPVDINRTKTGRIPAAKKPTRIRNKKAAFVKQGKGGTRIVAERQRDGSLRVWYVLAKSANIDRRFHFFEDGIDEIERVFSGHMNSRMNRVLSKSRFNSR